MSFDTTIIKFDSLDEKVSGDLIKPEDWNALVANIVEMGRDLKGLLGDLDVRVTGIDNRVISLETDVEALTDQLNTVEGDVELLQGRVGVLEGLDVIERPEFDAFKATIVPLLNQYQITLKTRKVNYLMGESAAIIAEVKTLDGQIPNPLPWVDFISTWGKMSVAELFESRPGFGGRSISVRTNSEGIAKIMIAAEQSESLSTEEEGQIHSFLRSRVSTDNGIRQLSTILNDSDSTASSEVQAAFGAISKEVDKSVQTPTGRFVDQYYLQSTMLSPLIWRQPTSSWQDHRTTITAHVKNDADPTTPDQSRGSSSMQINFRDWISPWLGHYFDDIQLQPAIDLFIPHFTPLIPDDLEVSLQGIHEKVTEIIEPGGLIQRQRNYFAIGNAIQLQDFGPKIQDQVQETVHQAIAGQQAVDVQQLATGQTGLPIFSSFLNQAIVADKPAREVSALTFRADQMESDLASKTGQLERDMASLSASTVDVGEQVNLKLNNIENKVLGIDLLDKQQVTADIGAISAKIGEINRLIRP